MESLAIDASLHVQLARWATLLEVPLDRLVTHLLVVGVARLEQGVENVSALESAERLSRQTLAAEGDTHVP